MDIELTEEEKGWWDNIRAYFSNRELMRRDSGEFLRDQIGEQQVFLTKSLFDRESIPQRRLEWLTNADFFVGKSKKSRWGMICHNAGYKKAHLIFRLPFWGERYLPFFLGIIDLPQELIDQFRKDASNRMNNGYDMGQMYRGVAKAYNLKKDDAEEFYKLAVDCGYDHYDCRTIRNAIFTYLRK